MAVFPENMDKLDPQNVSASLSTVENYIRYMGERMEFSMQNVTRNVSAAGMSNAQAYVMIVAIQNDISALKSTVNGMNGTLTGLSGEAAELRGSLAALTGRVNAGEGAAQALADRAAALEEENRSLKEALQEVKDRLNTLEGLAEEGKE